MRQLATLHDLFLASQNSEKPLATLSSLCHIFRQICQKVCYTQSKTEIHPSDIKFGRYGEVSAVEGSCSCSGLQQLFHKMLTLVHPYEYVPSILSSIATREYESVEEMLHDLVTYLEARPDWIQVQRLDMRDGEHWEQCKLGKWLTHASFNGDIKIQAKVRWNAEGCIGFFLYADKTSLGEAIWISSKKFEKGVFHKIAIECRDNALFVYVDERLFEASCSFLPKNGAQIGLMLEDTETSIEDFSVFTSGKNFRPNPLAVSDHILAEKQYIKAYGSYLEQAYSYHGQEVGKRALFYAGLSLLEKAKKSRSKKAFAECMLEFEKLFIVDAAPLGYLGKALVLHEQKKYMEEAAVLEEAFQHSGKHPFATMLKLYLMSRLSREGSLAYFLHASRHIPFEEMSLEAHNAIMHYKATQEPLFCA